MRRRTALLVPLAATALVGAALLVPVSPPATAGDAITAQGVEYEQGGTKLEGLLALPSGGGAKHPAVLVFHDWMGVGPFVKTQVERLAAMGYVAFAPDVYGKGVRPSSPQEAGAQATKYKSDRSLLRARAVAGLDVLAKHAAVDPGRIAATGYCFGGTAALELARSGAPVVGVVSFHGGLSTPTPDDAKSVRGKVLALHGADDPFVPMAEVAAFEGEMRGGKVDWQLVKYGGAVHAFTNPAAGSDPSKGAAYDAAADRRSWEAMRDFLSEVFGTAR